MSSQTTTPATAGTVTLSPTGTNNDIQFTDAGATGTTGVFPEGVFIEFVDPGANSSALDVTVATAANGDKTITVSLGTDGTGAITSHTAGVINAVNADVEANVLVTAANAGTDDGTGVAAAVAATQLADGTDSSTAPTANAGILLTDARATATTGVFAEAVAVEFVNAGANQTLDVAVATAANGDKTITVNLATDGSGVITSTAADVIAALNGDTEANQLVAAANESGHDGSGLVSAISAQTMADGTDSTTTPTANADILLTDARATAGTGVFDQAVAIEFVNAGASQVLDVTVATAANGDKTITVNLATDAGGIVTSTAAQVIAAINDDDEAGALVTAANATGSDGSGLVGVLAAETLADGTDGELTLTSTDYGSAEFVDINVLKGTFATTLADGTTAAARDGGTDIGVTINGIAAQGTGLQASVKTAMLDAAITFQDAANAVGESATVNITGGGSVFQIGEQATTAGQIGVGLDAINTARLGGVSGKLYELGTGGGKSLLDIGPNVQGIDLVSIIDEALDKVNSLRGRLGSLQKNVIETNIQTLSVALENISEARSEIVDADFAVETANMTKGQVLTQAGMSVLAIANQNPAQVLSLFR